MATTKQAKQVWNKLEIETDYDYLAFRRYLFLGSNRNLLEAINAYESSSNSEIPEYWVSVISKNNWESRAKDFDEYVLTSLQELGSLHGITSRVKRNLVNEELHSLLLDLIKECKNEGVSLSKVKELVGISTKLHADMRVEDNLNDASSSNSSNSSPNQTPIKQPAQKVVLNLPSNNR